MNYFFGNTYLANSVDWFFNLNHLFLIFVVASVILALYFGLHAKTAKGIKATKLVLAGVMFVLEIGRIVWYYYDDVILNGGVFNWWWRISFQMCAIMTWTTIVTLVLSAFLKKDNKALVILKNVLFGTAMIGGILTFVYPDFIHESMPLFVFVNIQSLLVHAFLIFVPLYLIKTGDLHIRLKNIWMPALGFLGVGSVSMTASQISGQNFAYALACNLLPKIGLNIPFPWHIFVVFGIVFFITAILYSANELIYHIKHKGEIVTKPAITNKKMFAMYVITMALSGVIGLAFQILIPFTFAKVPVQNLLGLFCLLPIIVTIGIIVAGFKLKALAYKK